MKEKRLLLGDEAIALGAINAGLSGVYAYPGTPSTEITEFIQTDPAALEKGIRSRWCTNEKTAMEAALGMSYAGKRALVCMKHVGMNVCADAFVNSAITGTNGGLVVLAADDPSMHSSQNEQDSRFYASFAMVPVFEPSTQQEAYDMVAEAFDLSERYATPVVLRVVTRLAHSRAGVEVGEVRAQNALNPSADRGWVLLPAIARRQYAKLIDKQPALLEDSCNSRFNKLEIDPQAGLGIIACGIAYNYVREALASSGLKASVLKVSRYPLPEKQIRELAAASSRILVIEDGQPVVESKIHELLGAGAPIEGRLTGALPRTGELTPDNVALALGCEAPQLNAQAQNLAARPPQLCPGCGHRDVYAALNKVLEEYPDARVFGDIGCYTLGALPPFKTLASCVDMGASITMAKGAADSGLFPAVAVIGDSTFTHSGMTGLLDAVNDNANITVVISDNLTTAMTGGQDSAGTNKFEAICKGLGVEPEHIRVVVPIPANMPQITEIIREEINYKGVSVIIPRRECMQTLRRHQASRK
ncbi:MAG: indolepyruvate ferredoxin oxidoreductase subunit alpha [Bacteroidales bacterium]|nr:indolepyruvate ferredoxin oxidoreductase subunit alpha [Bacteroidales bacterium]